MNITLYGFRKRRNSTKLPETSGLSRQVVLKDNCTTVNPVWELNFGNQDPSSFNYCYCVDWGYYYFIDNWLYNGRLWEAHCTRDPMATFRKDILSSGCYVLRSASEWDLGVGDIKYPAKTEVHFDGTLVNTNWARSFTSGVFIVGVVGFNNQSSQPGLTYYAMLPSQMVDLYNFIFSNTPLDESGSTMTWGDLSVVRYAECAITNIMDFSKYVVSIMWFPFAPPISESSDLHIAYWNSGIHVGYLTTTQYYAEYDIPIKKHPSAGTRGKYLNCYPYSEYTLFTPCFGAIDVDSTKLVDATNLHLEMSVDLITGVGGLRLSADLAGFIGQYTGQVGVPQLLAGAKSTGIAGAVEGGATLGGAMAAAVSGNGISIGSMSAGINSIFSSVAPRASVSGSQGTSLLYSPIFDLELRYFNPVEEALAKFGRPLCQNKILNTLSGFCQVEDGDIVTKATPAEKMTIKQYLEGGFYIE